MLLQLLKRRPWTLAELTSPNDPRIEAAAEQSPLVLGPQFSDHADREELVFWEEVEDFGDGLASAYGFFRQKRVLDFFDYALRRCAIDPSGTVVELGAGSCWASAALACFPDVERVVSVEFSRRRLTVIAPASIAVLSAPAEKIERRLADFYAHGLPDGTADLVVMDAAFHHAADPARMAGVLFDLTKPGGSVMLMREPTLNFLKRSRDHGITDDYGNFEREYYRPEYLNFLRRAGFDARSVGVRWFHSSRWRRAIYHPPVTFLSGVLRGHWVYVGRKPRTA
jgi:SAM-dependent methyltransferase